MKATSPSRLRRQGRPASRQRGATAVEFAFVLMPMVWLIMGLIEVGLFLTAQYELQNAVLDASRKIRTGDIKSTNSPAPTAATFKAEICSKIFMVRNCASKLRIEVRSASGGTFGNLDPVTGTAGTRMSDLLSFGPSSAETFALGQAGDPGSLIATYDWPLVTPLVGYLFSNIATDKTKRRLHGIAVYKIEKYS